MPMYLYYEWARWVHWPDWMYRVIPWRRPDNSKHGKHIGSFGGCGVFRNITYLFHWQLLCHRVVVVLVTCFVLKFFEDTRVKIQQVKNLFTLPFWTSRLGVYARMIQWLCVGSGGSMAPMTSLFLSICLFGMQFKRLKKKNFKFVIFILDQQALGVSLIITSDYCCHVIVSASKMYNIQLLVVR